MNIQLNRFAAAIASAFLLSSVSFAQGSAAPASRAEVKAATRSAETAGKLLPAGEAASVAVPNTSETTRARRKAEARAQTKAGSLPPAGPGGTQKIDQEIRSRPSTVDRDARKAETRAAEKAGTLVPAGEGSPAPRR